VSAAQTNSLRRSFRSATSHRSISGPDVGGRKLLFLEEWSEFQFHGGKLYVVC